MKKIYFLLLMLSIPFALKAQKWSIEANYVLPVGDNFLQQNYNGIAEMGVKYRFINLWIAKIGGSLKASSYLANANFASLAGVTAQGIFLQPKIFIELAEVPFTSIHPFVEFGYDYLIIRSPGNTQSSIDTQDGGSIEGGIMYEIVERFFIQAMVDFTRLRDDGVVINNSFNRNLYRIKAGIGIRI